MFTEEQKTKLLNLVSRHRRAFLFDMQKDYDMGICDFTSEDYICYFANKLKKAIKKL